MWSSVQHNGSGRLFRIGVAAELSEPERSSLSLLGMAAALALEAATLRGASDPFEAAASDERPPEIPGFVAASPEMPRLKSARAPGGLTRDGDHQRRVGLRQPPDLIEVRHLRLLH